jgi:hypothetical protein
MRSLRVVDRRCEGIAPRESAMILAGRLAMSWSDCASDAERGAAVLEKQALCWLSWTQQRRAIAMVID